MAITLMCWGVGSSMRREHTPDILRLLARQFPSKHKCGHKTGRIKRAHKLSHPEAIAELLLARRQQHFDRLIILALDLW